MIKQGIKQKIKSFALDDLNTLQKHRKAIDLFDLIKIINQEKNIKISIVYSGEPDAKLHNKIAPGFNYRTYMPCVFLVGSHKDIEIFQLISGK